MNGQLNWNSRKTLSVGLAGLLVVIVAGACATPTAAPEATPVPTISTATSAPAPTATTAPTREPTAVPTPTPTHTPTPLAPTATPEPSARYELTFEATWSEVSHPLAFPPNPHFSGLIGASHSPAVQLWTEGEGATPGIQNMAETGGKSPLDGEIAVLIDNGDACGVISGGGINPSPGSVMVTFTVTQDCPLVSVVSMVAPSPDWFVGVSGLSLLEDGGWVEQKVVELAPYDAGTDSGGTYTAPNEPTADPETIHKIEVAPLLIDGAVPPLGTFTFTRVSDD